MLALFSPLPALTVALTYLWTGEHLPTVRWTLSVLAIGPCVAGAFVVRARVVRALQNIANLLAGLRQGDFSVRGRPAQPHDALGETLLEVNQLAETLSNQRVGALEASALLGKVMAEIDVAIFAFDRGRSLRLVNHAGERLLGVPAERLLGTIAVDLGMESLLGGEAPRIVEAAFAGGQGQWELRRGSFRLGGLPHELVVLTDVQRALREEERQAWQRLVRVLGHEINNSLAPIRSIAGNLHESLRRPDDERPEDWKEDMAGGLAVIERRSEALGRFMSSYARLARLPPPRAGSVNVGAWIRRVIELEKRLPVVLAQGPDLIIPGDGDQLEQLLINLVQNAVDAALETGGKVEITWQRLPRQVEVVIADEGAGVANTRNLFVPFFTTKPSGSGIGLVLSRQIAEAHRGTLVLESRVDRTGAQARLRLPI